MFLVQNNVPEVYVDESRDFQLISKLYDLAFQCTRNSALSLKDVSDTMYCHSNLLPLIGTKVGFFSNLNLTDRSYRMVLSAFPHIIRYKGSFKAIQLIANVFERITNTQVTVTLDPLERNTINIKFQSYSPNFSLLKELVETVRPAGVIINYSVVTDINIPATFSTQDVVDIGEWINEYDMSVISRGKEKVYTDTDSSTTTYHTGDIGFTQIVHKKIKSRNDKYE